MNITAALVEILTELEVEPTEANVEHAWDILLEAYDNEEFDEPQM